MKAPGQNVVTRRGLENRCYRTRLLRRSRRTSRTWIARTASGAPIRSPVDPPIRVVPGRTRVQRRPPEPCVALREPVTGPSIAFSELADLRASALKTGSEQVSAESAFGAGLDLEEDFSLAMERDPRGVHDETTAMTRTALLAARCARKGGEALQSRCITSGAARVRLSLVAGPAPGWPGGASGTAPATVGAGHRPRCRKAPPSSAPPVRPCIPCVIRPRGHAGEVRSADLRPAAPPCAARSPVPRQAGLQPPSAASLTVTRGGRRISPALTPG